MEIVAGLAAEEAEDGSEAGCDLLHPDNVPSDRPISAMRKTALAARGWQILLLSVQISVISVIRGRNLIWFVSRLSPPPRAPCWQSPRRRTRWCRRSRPRRA